MKSITKVIFAIFSIITLISQLFGVIIILSLLAVLTGKIILFVSLAVVYVVMDLWRHASLKKQGYKPIIGGYKK